MTLKRRFQWWLDRKLGELQRRVRNYDNDHITWIPTPEPGLRTKVLQVAWADEVDKEIGWSFSGIQENGTLPKIDHESK